jgi:acyl-coenzyme A synthetase/AMP-(fatty) acid ligase
MLRIRGVAQVGVCGLKHATLGETVGAAIVLEAGSDLTEREVREYVRHRLPACAVPDRIRFVQSLPVTVTGKLDRRRLSSQLQADVHPREQPAAGSVDGDARSGKGGVG